MNRIMKLLVSVLAVGVAAQLSAAPLSRLDLFDKADNHLYFVTFDYDAKGKNTGRSVFTSDSTFLYYTAITRNGSGGISKENSIDYLGNGLFNTSLSASGSTTTFRSVDQFGLDRLGGSMSYASSGTNAFIIKQNGATHYSLSYEYTGSGTLSKISIRDKSGALCFYATPPVKSSAVTSRSAPVRSPVIEPMANGRLRCFFDLRVPSRVTLELFTPAGRLVAQVVDETLGSGRIAMVRKVAAGSGAYLVRLSLDGRTHATARCFITR